ncbi:hypothetical protein AJ79_05640 [Helicocarpus griseus UAMH5409]|uniref:Uncharacterized protein n=1 Tax=Helicocarpus griseus UAMH5409 TaxID=1447875 RepID=A0A2B7XDE7_9EURO|nr:hypothetical protein AJ79_05640 [Helicocarpus griseus UAMH5409]
MLDMQQKTQQAVNTPPPPSKISNIASSKSVKYAAFVGAPRHSQEGVVGNIMTVDTEKGEVQLLPLTSERPHLFQKRMAGHRYNCLPKRKRINRLLAKPGNSKGRGQDFSKV